MTFQYQRGSPVRPTIRAQPSTSFGQGPDATGSDQSARIRTTAQIVMNGSSMYGYWYWIGVGAIAPIHRNGSIPSGRMSSRADSERQARPRQNRQAAYRK